MAIDYFHRLVVFGSRRGVQRFAAGARRRVRYPADAGLKAFSETLPFSFESLWKRHRELSRFTRLPPHDPYYVRGWRMRAVTPRQHFVRYQFQTCNMTMTRIVRLLSGANPSLAFVLMTMCLDDSSIESWFMEAGRRSHYQVPLELMEATVAAEIRAKRIRPDNDRGMARGPGERGACADGCGAPPLGRPAVRRPESRRTVHRAESAPSRGLRVGSRGLVGRARAAGPPRGVAADLPRGDEALSVARRGVWLTGSTANGRGQISGTTIPVPPGAG
jgi:hypothetical protein